MKPAKKLYPTLVILLVSKLPAGKVVKAQLVLKLEKKKFPTALVILLVSKLQAGKELRDQPRLKLEKK